jgi:ketosteroid isomerase-like protein
VTQPSTPAGRLVSAFGRPEQMAALYAPDITWSLPRGLMQQPMVGIEAVCAFNQMVWTQSYRPDCEVEILDEVGDEHSSAVRIIYRAHMLMSDQLYENEYQLFVRADDEGIHEVSERMDTVALLDALTGQKIGTTFAAGISARG